MGWGEAHEPAPAPTFDWSKIIELVAEANPECPVCGAPIKPDEWADHVSSCIKIEENEE